MTPLRQTSFRNRLAPVLFVTLLSALLIAVVSAAHLITRPVVERNRTRYLQRAVLEAAGWTVPASSSQMEALFESRARLVPEAPDAPFAVVQDPGGRDDRLVFLETGRGLWGPIQAAVAFSSLDGAMAGLAFVAHNETPGLGARIEEPAFRRQFIGKRPPLALSSSASTGSPNPSEMDGLTGATITSQGVRDLINRAAQRVRPDIKSATPTAPEMLLER